ncbi:MAG: FBP domain-containing protein [Trebonia sp.]
MRDAMESLTADDIRKSLVNCSKGEASRLAVPRDLAGQPWDDLDFFGWRDLSGADRACIVAEVGDRMVGVVLRCVSASSYKGLRVGGRASMCSLCLTTHPGQDVTLMAAPRRTNRDNTVGIRICADLACSLYVRGIKNPPPGGRLTETLTVDEQAERVRGNLSAFLAKV